KLVLDKKLKYWLPLFSTTEKNADVAERVRQLVGSTDPKVWVAAFLVAEHVRQWLNTDDPAVWVPAFQEAERLSQSLNTQDPDVWMPAFKAVWTNHLHN
ncbi:MAG: conjugal transfer protein, partial [Cytophagaceae bacterium]